MTKQMLSTPLLVVYEGGITKSLEFKQALESEAYAVHAVNQDPAETYRELCRAWRTGMTVLGCTKGAAAFVLGELARERGGKMLVYREHRCPNYLVTWGILS